MAFIAKEWTVIFGKRLDLDLDFSSSFLIHGSLKVSFCQNKFSKANENQTYLI